MPQLFAFTLKYNPNDIVDLYLYPLYTAYIDFIGTHFCRIVDFTFEDKSEGLPTKLHVHGTLTMRTNARHKMLKYTPFTFWTKKVFDHHGWVNYQAKHIIPTLPPIPPNPNLTPIYNPHDDPQKYITALVLYYRSQLDYYLGQCETHEDVRNIPPPPPLPT